ncbi:MAG TPA: hypothetical protein PKB14_11980 [Rubrivivax sp.]|nr:hypothetical protein [Rubrivivax sp.]
MNPHVLRIAGASYSGSTAFGHFLNTAPGFMFGSELYRLLPVFMRSSDPPRITPCDHCGADCSVWTNDLRAALQQRPDSGLADVYDAFFASVDTARVLVDGSKLKRWYAYGPEPQQACSYVVTVKHPMRLLASFVYNDTNLIPHASRSSLESAAGFLDEHLDQAVAFAQAQLVRAHAQYAELLEFVSGDEMQLCRTDERASVLAVLQALSARHDAVFDLQELSRIPCHSLGGNRSIRWQVGGYAAGPGRPAQDRARFDYYKSQTQDFFVQDNKFARLFSPVLRERIASLPPYRPLGRLLGYDDAPDLR